MPNYRSQLFRQSRDTRLLLRVAASIGIAGLMAGFVISLFTADSGRRPFFSDDPSGLPPNPLENLPAKSASFDLWAEFIRDIDPEAALATGDLPSASPRSPGRSLFPTVEPPSAEEIVSLIGTALAGLPLPESERVLLADLLTSLHGRDDSAQAEALKRLQTRATKEPPQRHAAELLGDSLSRAARLSESIDAYRLELDRFPAEADHALHRLATLLALEGRFAERDALMDSGEFRDRFSILDRLQRATARRDHLAMLKYVVLQDLLIGEPWLALLSVFAATVWFAIVTQFAGQRREQLWRYLVALALGYFSATATLYIVIVQEEIQGFSFDPKSDPTSQLIYCIAGIGLREETLKLLFFVPLAWWLVRKGGEIDALVCAGLCGLGFAVNENVGYVEHGGAFTAWSRFLSANFAHIAFTGIAGLALVRAWHRPKRQWDNFLYDFLIVVTAHGAYDALLMMPSLSDYNFAVLIVYALVAYLFLDRAIELMRPQGSMAVSPLAVFMVGGALLISVTFCYASWGLPFRLALAEYAGNLAGVVPIAFIFINRLRHL